LLGRRHYSGKNMRGCRQRQKHQRSEPSIHFLIYAWQLDGSQLGLGPFCMELKMNLVVNYSCLHIVNLYEVLFTDLVLSTYGLHFQSFCDQSRFLYLINIYL
jgi:hypothetical protein